MSRQVSRMVARQRRRALVIRWSVRAIFAVVFLILAPLAAVSWGGALFALLKNTSTLPLGMVLLYSLAVAVPMFQLWFVGVTSEAALLASADARELLERMDRLEKRLASS